MTTTRALAVAAYLSAVAAPAGADWRSIADQLHAALPAVRGAAVKPAADAPAGAVPRWFADWKLGKVYSLDSLAVTFADGAIVRVNLAKAPGKSPRIAAACRVAIAFYRASTGRDSVPAFATLVAASDGESFDAAACSALTDGLRRTAHVVPAVRPAVTVEAISRMESELERRRAGLAAAEAMPDRIKAFVIPLCLSWDARGRAEAELRGMKESAAMAEAWRAAIAAGERELSAMQLDAMRAAVADPAPVAPVTVAAAAEASAVAAEPVAAPFEAEPVPCEPAAAVPAAEAVPVPAVAEPVTVTVPVVEPGPVAVEPVPAAPHVVAAPAAEPCNDDAPVPPMPGAPAPAVPAARADAGPAHPVEAIADAAAHLEPMALCPALGLPCKVDCGFRPGCGRPVPHAAAEASQPVEAIGEADPLDAEPLHPLCSDDDAPAVVGPVTVLCLSMPSRVAIVEACGMRAVPTEARGAKHGAFRLSVEDAAACAGIRSVRFIGLPRKPYTRAGASTRTPIEAIRTPVEAIAVVPQSAPFLAALATSMRRGYAACYAASTI